MAGLEGHASSRESCHDVSPYACHSVNPKLARKRLILISNPNGNDQNENNEHQNAGIKAHMSASA